MRRVVIALAASAILFATAGVASASSHGAMPPNLDFFQTVQWELQHFAMHMQYTWHAIQTWFVSHELGWAFLNDQALCAPLTPLMGVLFGSAAASLLTFALTIVFGAAMLLWLTQRLARKLYALYGNEQHSVARA